jgi:protein-L-isoaspartate(D-aspartate) O-methyltransferase
MGIWSLAGRLVAKWRQNIALMSDFPWENDWPEITDIRVRAAFVRVPRVAFMPEDVQKWSHCDSPLPIGEGQTISQPFVVALMTQALHLKPGDKVLEIGTGSGFQTAILAELTTAEGTKAGEPTSQTMPGQSVYSIERHATLATQAAEVLSQQGYQPHLRVGDGAEGWPSQAPFDAIILTAAPVHLPRPLWEQLGDGGRMVAPIGASPDDQKLWLLRKIDGSMKRESIGAVRFVPMLTPLLDDPTMRIEFQ